MESKKIYICHTYYHVLVALVKEITHDIVDADVVICDTIPDFQRIINPLKKANIFNNVFTFNETNYKTEISNKKSFLSALFTNQKYRKMIKTSFELKKGTYKDIFIFNDWNFFGYFLRSNKLYYSLLEDAKDSFKVLENYVKINYHKSTKQRLFGFIYETLFFYGKSKYTKIVEVNDSSGLKIPKEKIRVKSKQEMFDKLTDDQKKKIYEIFVHDRTKEITLKKNKKSALILSQPLFEDSMVDTEEMQRRVYRDIIENYCNGLNVVIKPHPRDEFNYESEYNEVTVINKNLPTEILSFNNSDINFEKAITVSSSSINGIDFVSEKIYLGFEWLKKYQ